MITSPTSVGRITRPQPPARVEYPKAIIFNRVDALVWIERAGLSLNWGIAYDVNTNDDGPVPMRGGESYGGRHQENAVSIGGISSALRAIQDKTPLEIVVFVETNEGPHLQARVAEQLSWKLPPGVRLADSSELNSHHPLLQAAAESVTPSVIRGGPVMIATDGSVSLRNGHAGWGWVSSQGDFGLGALGSTLDVCHAELSAILNATRRVRSGRGVRVMVDSTEAIATIDRYITQDGNTYGLSRRRRAAVQAIGRTAVRELAIEKVQAHAGNPLNEGADRLAKLARRASEHSLPADKVWRTAAGIRDDVVSAIFHP